MAGNVLLDTNIVIALFAKDPVVMEKLSNTEAVFIPSVVLGELLYGALESARQSENVRRVEDFAAGRTVLNCDAWVARAYGQIKHELRTRGTPIPDNDIWIAAVAREHVITVISRDAHFQKVPDLKLEVW